MKDAITMARTVSEILAERNARIAKIKAQYTAKVVNESAMMADYINSNSSTEQISDEARELNAAVNAIAAEYADEIAAAEAAEQEAEPVPEWFSNLFEI